MKYKPETFRQTAIYLALSVSIIIIIFFSDKLMNIPHEILTGWGLLCLAFILNKMESFKNTPGRLFFIFITALISIRYFFWRTFETLIYTGPLDLIGMALIYSAECYAITIHILGMFINVLPLNRSPLPLPDNPSDLPTVDVFIPTYNESEEIVRLTVTAATHIDYPKEKIYIHILDDGSTFAKRNNHDTSHSAWERHYSFKRMASELGVNYITREDNSHAKAGNLNNALKNTHGDIILFLDCDHVPTRDILKNTVGFFINDVKLFLVQMPHFFINPTTVEKNIGSFSSAPGENDMFYQVI
ncbi:MAG: glycosyltransferase, partial [Nitrospinota bacterium]